jgi:hypothetical protein
MTQDEMIGMLEEQGLNQAKIDEFMTEYRRTKEVDSELPDGRERDILNLRYSLGFETDPRKKAAIAARIISLGLEY